jgi:16S rRNA processing protein RimM
MGRIVAPFGVKGWIKVKIFTETPDSLLDYPRWWLRTREGWQAHVVAEAESVASGLIVRLQGCADRTAAEQVKGKDVGIPRAEFPRAKAEEFYWTDLIGLAVINTHGESLGRIENLLETGANDVLVVRGERERLIPYIDHVIKSVNLAEGQVVVDWGLDY